MSAFTSRMKTGGFPLLIIIGMGALLSSCHGISSLPDKPVEATEEADPAENKSEKSPTKPGTLSEIPVGSVHQLVQSQAALIYDVRPKIFYKMDHIPGAISFPEDSFDKAISKHEPDIRTANKNNTPVILYCTDAACPDALVVAEKLLARGHDIALLRGGYASWKQATKSNYNP